METEMVDYETRRVTSPSPSPGPTLQVLAADDRTETVIREALRDRQALQAAGALGGGL